jgi:hypothetical protein
MLRRQLAESDLDERSIPIPNRERGGTGADDEDVRGGFQHGVSICERRAVSRVIGPDSMEARNQGFGA